MKKRKRKKKLLPPATRKEINDALQEFLSHGGVVTKIVTNDDVDPARQYLGGFGQSFQARE